MNHLSPGIIHRVNIHITHDSAHSWSFTHFDALHCLPVWPLYPSIQPFLAKDNVYANTKKEHNSAEREGGFKKKKAEVFEFVL